MTDPADLSAKEKCAQIATAMEAIETANIWFLGWRFRLALSGAIGTDEHCQQELEEFGQSVNAMVEYLTTVYAMAAEYGLIKEEA